MRGVLSGTVEEILARAANHPQRRIIIGTREDANKPVICLVRKSQSYNTTNTMPRALCVTPLKNDLCRVAEFGMEEQPRKRRRILSDESPTPARKRFKIQTSIC